ncbi:MAG TPA: sulfite exporter TauE/SafE family protein [Kofleriaceae bacterium]|nr:sulfite exporter TauE/SafE family protein [Kofleriaceae bacterium]
MDLNLVIDGHSVWLPAVVLLSLGVGLISGMFGVGGGFLLVPLLHVTLGVPVPAAVGVALCQTIATALGALLRYRDMGHVEGRFDVMLLGGSLIGVDAGARLLQLLSGGATMTLFGRELLVMRVVVTVSYLVVFSIIAALLWWKPTPTAEAPRDPGPLARLRLPPYTRLPLAGVPRVSGPVIGFIGLANGILAGLVGIGGGIILIPIMLYGFGFDIRKTAGTGIAVVLAVAIVGTVRHASLGNVHLGLAATVMIGAALAAQVGATLTRSLSATTLRRALALVMLATLVALMTKLFAGSAVAD